MHLIDKRTRRYPEAVTPGDLEAPAKGNRIYYDSGHKDAVKGFGVRVTVGGAKSFVLNYHVNGRERRYTIGDYPSYAVTAAREEAKKLRQKIRAEGYDPLAKLQAERGAPTVADLCEFYIEHHLHHKRPAPAKTDKYAIERVILPKLRHHKVSEVTFADINKIHRDITKGGASYRANRVLALLSTMFNLAIKEGWRSDNPCKGVKKNPETPRERYASPDELVRLLDALAKHPDQDEANAVRLLMLTGARRGEVLSMQFDHINFEKGTWTKPSAHTKQKKMHHVPLSTPALLILAEMRSRVFAEQVYVFPGPGKHGHRADLKKPWVAICKAAGITGLRLHDLRHSYASLLAEGGASLPMIGKLLGHTQAATTLRYAHLGVDPLRGMTERVGAVIEGAAKLRELKGDIVH